MKRLLILPCALILLSSVLAKELYSRPNVDLGEVNADGFVRVEPEMLDLERRDEGTDTSDWNDNSRHHNPPPPPPPPPPNHGGGKPGHDHPPPSPPPSHGGGNPGNGGDKHPPGRGR